jgi:hypothetical protein
MTDHIDTRVLESSILAPDALGKEELDRIRLHLESCSLCRENMESLGRMYRATEKELEAPPSERDRQTAGRVLPRGLVRRTPEERIIEAYADVVEPYKRPIADRFVRFIRLHPYQSSGAILIVGAALALLVAVFTPVKDKNPTYAEIKNYVLYVYNKEAEVLWKKGVPGMPDWTSRTIPSLDQNYPKRFLSVEDIDGKNLNSVLLVGPSGLGEFTNDTLYCFDRNGALRWKAGIGPMISFGRTENKHHSRALIADFLVMRKAPRLMPQIFVLANEKIYSPTKLVEVSPRNGTILQSYFNRGGCAIMLHKDIDLDGNEELLVGGVNDGFNRACLAILDPTNVGGSSPVPPDEMPPQGTGGREMYYLLFPRWGLGHLDGRRIYNDVRQLINPQGGGIDVAVNEQLVDLEKIETVDGSLIFSLGPTLSVDRIMADDTVIRIGNALYKQGKISAPITSGTYSSLKDSLLFWDGDRFANTPTMNTHYKTPAARPPEP